MTQPGRKLVAAGLITSRDGQLLITQRRPSADPALSLKWELPGGKIEPGESPGEALARELEEELGVRVVIGRIWDVLYHRYQRYEVIMLIFHCRLVPGQTPKCLEVNDLAWCVPAQLGDYDILEADRSLVERLVRDGLPRAIAVRNVDPK